METSNHSSVFMAGIRVIEQTLIKAAKVKGLNLSEDNFRWNDGHSLIPPPDVTKLVLRLGAKNSAHTFSRDQIVAGPAGKTFQVTIKCALNELAT